MNKSLISIIVPVYKVEEFLDECVQSLLNQTYKNLEIILVDDGSPDNCPQKCDNWERKDKRVRVIHKENGGLSSARNAGLEKVTGDFISFVDSDDFFDDKMYEILYEGITRSPNIGISAIKFLRYENGESSIYNPKWDTKNDVLIKSQDFAIKMVKMEICFASTNKLYRKELLQKVRFREGRLNEDTLFAFDLAKEVEKLKVDMWDLNYYAYYYRMRHESICHSTIPIEIPYMDNLQLMIRETDDQDYKKAILLMYNRAVYSLNCKLFLELSESDFQRIEYRQYRSMFKKMRYKDVRDERSSVKDFLKFSIAKYSPFIFSLLREFRSNGGKQLILKSEE